MSLTRLCACVLCAGEGIIRGIGGIEDEEVGGKRGVEFADLVPRRLDFFEPIGATVGVKRFMLGCRLLEGRPEADTAAAGIVGCSSSLAGDEVRRFLLFGPLGAGGVDWIALGATEVET